MPSGITGHPVWHDALMGYTVGDGAAISASTRRDSAPYMPRCVVEDPSFSWGVDRPPGHKPTPKASSTRPM
jgi:isoamylase